MRALALYATGGITLKALADAKAGATTQIDITNPGKAKTTKKKPTLRLPAVIPPISDSEIHKNIRRPSAFSAVGWAGPASSMYAKCLEKINDEKMVSIIDEAKLVSKATRQHAREADSDFDPDDSICQLGNGSEASSDEE